MWIPQITSKGRNQPWPLSGVTAMVMGIMLLLPWLFPCGAKRCRSAFLAWGGPSSPRLPSQQEAPTGDPLPVAYFWWAAISLVCFWTTLLAYYLEGEVV